MRAPQDERGNGESAAQRGATPRLYQQASAILADQIRAGILAPGARIGETTVATQFGISRAPARQALNELVALGLVEKSKGRGYRVRSVASLPVEAPVAVEDIRLSSLATWERIYAEVESEITARIAFAPWRVNEAELARFYAVSRTVARDVVGRLQQRGIVRKDDRSRWFAPALTRDRVDSLYELRAILEPVALRKAAGHAPSDFVAQIRDNLAEATRRAHDIPGGTLDALEEDLHIMLLGYCGNEALMDAITVPQSLLIAHRFLYRWTPRLFETEPFLPEHKAILDLFAAGETEAAAKALEDHLYVSRERAVARIDVIVRDFAPDPLPYLDPLA